MKWFILSLILLGCKIDSNKPSSSSPNPIPTPAPYNLADYGFQDKTLYYFNYNEPIKKLPTGQTVSLGIYGKRFKELALSLKNLTTNINSTQIGFDSSLSSTTLGICNLNNNTIYLNPDFWFNKNTTNSRREFVIFHELGHCVLLRLHKTDQTYTRDTSVLTYSSMMNTTIFSYTHYEKNHYYYTSELFDENHSPIDIYTNNSSQFGSYYPLALSLPNNQTLNLTVPLYNNDSFCGTTEE